MDSTLSSRSDVSRARDPSLGRMFMSYTCFLLVYLLFVSGVVLYSLHLDHVIDDSHVPRFIPRVCIYLFAAICFGGTMYKSVVARKHEDTRSSCLCLAMAIVVVITTISFAMATLYEDGVQIALLHPSSSTRPQAFNATTGLAVVNIEEGAELWWSKYEDNNNQTNLPLVHSHAPPLAAVAKLSFPVYRKQIHNMRQRLARLTHSQESAAWSEPYPEPGEGFKWFTFAVHPLEPVFAPPPGPQRTQHDSTCPLLSSDIGDQLCLGSCLQVHDRGNLSWPSERRCDEPAGTCLPFTEPIPIDAQAQVTEYLEAQRFGGSDHRCLDTCMFANDGVCHDDASLFSLVDSVRESALNGSEIDKVCAHGTDCGDCGPRTKTVRNPLDEQVREPSCGYPPDELFHDQFYATWKANARLDAVEDFPVRVKTLGYNVTRAATSCRGAGKRLCTFDDVNEAAKAGSHDCTPGWVLGGSVRVNGFPSAGLVDGSPCSSKTVGFLTNSKRWGDGPNDGEDQVWCCSDGDTQPADVPPLFARNIDASLSVRFNGTIKECVAICQGTHHLDPDICGVIQYTHPTPANQFQASCTHTRTTSLIQRQLLSTLHWPNGDMVSTYPANHTDVVLVSRYMFRGSPPEGYFVDWQLQAVLLPFVAFPTLLAFTILIVCTASRDCMPEDRITQKEPCCWDFVLHSERSMYNEQMHNFRLVVVVFAFSLASCVLIIPRAIGKTMKPWPIVLVPVYIVLSTTVLSVIGLLWHVLVKKAEGQERHLFVAFSIILPLVSAVVMLSILLAKGTEVHRVVFDTNAQNDLLLLGRVFSTVEASQMQYFWVALPVAIGWVIALVLLSARLVWAWCRLVMRAIREKHEQFQITLESNFRSAVLLGCEDLEHMFLDPGADEARLLAVLEVFQEKPGLLNAFGKSRFVAMGHAKLELLEQMLTSAQVKQVWTRAVATEFGAALRSFDESDHVPLPATTQPTGWGQLKSVFDCVVFSCTESTTSRVRGESAMGKLEADVDRKTRQRAQVEPQLSSYGEEMVEV